MKKKLIVVREKHNYKYGSRKFVAIRDVDGYELKDSCLTALHMHMGYVEVKYRFDADVARRYEALLHTLIRQVKWEQLEWEMVPLLVDVLLESMSKMNDDGTLRRHAPHIDLLIETLEKLPNECKTPLILPRG